MYSFSKNKQNKSRDFSKYHCPNISLLQTGLLVNDNLYLLGYSNKIYGSKFWLHIFIEDILKV